MSESIKLCRAALDEADGEIILRGSIDPNSFHLLKTADYQREILALAKINDLVQAFKKGSVPDIELGMRGHRVVERQGCFYLQDDVYIVDGLQRVSAALHMMKQGGDKLPRLGATVHFGTTEEWERARFRILNADRTKLSPNVLMRNLRYDIPAIKLLHQLTEDKSFILHARVCWEQRTKRKELVTAVTYTKAVGALHSHIGPGRYNRTDDIARGLQIIMERTGRQVFKANTVMFFEIVDQCWGIRRVAFKEGAAYMRTTFLLALAQVFSRHRDFWRENRLFVEAPLLRKIALFPVTDPQVVALAGSGGKARDMLYLLMLEHINSGKRTKRLQPRTAETEPELIELNETDEEDEDEAAA
jgi:hypothetical protein